MRDLGTCSQRYVDLAVCTHAAAINSNGQMGESNKSFLAMACVLCMLVQASQGARTRATVNYQTLRDIDNRLEDLRSGTHVISDHTRIYVHMHTNTHKALAFPTSAHTSARLMSRCERACVVRNVYCVCARTTGDRKLMTGSKIEAMQVHVDSLYTTVSRAIDGARRLVAAVPLVIPPEKVFAVTLVPKHTYYTPLLTPPESRMHPVLLIRECARSFSCARSYSCSALPNLYASAVPRNGYRATSVRVCVVLCLHVPPQVPRELSDASRELEAIETRASELRQRLADTLESLTGDVSTAMASTEALMHALEPSFIPLQVTLKVSNMQFTHAYMQHIQQRA